MGVCSYRPASIDTVSGLRGDALISRDTLSIDLTSCCNDPLVLVKDHCLSRLALMHLECRIVMETVITREARQESSSGAIVHLCVALCMYEPTAKVNFRPS